MPITHHFDFPISGSISQKARGRGTASAIGRAIAASLLPIRAVHFHSGRDYRNSTHQRCISYTKSQSKFAWYGIHTGQIAGTNCLFYVISTRDFTSFLMPLECERSPPKTDSSWVLRPGKTTVQTPRQR